MLWLSSNCLHGIVSAIKMRCSISQSDENIRALLGLASFGIVSNDGVLAQQAAAKLVRISPEIILRSGLQEQVDMLLSRLFLLLVCSIILC